MSAIKLNIKPGGAIKMTVEGIQGASCHELTKPIEEAVAGAVVSSVDTAEIHQQPTTAGASINLKQ